MFCKNCGNEVAPGSAICLNCGVPVEGNMTGFCSNCGTQAMPGAVVCTNCGVALNANINSNATAYGVQQKSKIVAGILGILLGSFGIHNFYLGYTGKAVAQLLITLLTCGIGAVATSIWGLVEGIQILTGSINTDANGVPLSE